MLPLEERIQADITHIISNGRNKPRGVMLWNENEKPYRH